tara:strand:+ start:84 stop:362 length:279 start_codon:yes stop_codon:yes gene_type:complete
MIKSLKHKGLEKFYLKGTSAGVQAKYSKNLRFQLAALDSAQDIDDLDIPRYRLHPLKGQREGIWSITASANWRLTFEFIDENFYILNYEDHH